MSKYIQYIQIMDYFSGTKIHVYELPLVTWESVCTKMLSEKEEDTNCIGSIITIIYNIVEIWTCVNSLEFPPCFSVHFFTFH